MGTAATKASMYSKDNYPNVISIEKFQRSKYNCLLYEVTEPDNTKTFYVVCADTIGLYGYGNSSDEAILVFRIMVERRILEKLYGGIYDGTSDFEYQEKTFKPLERLWQEDGIEIVNKMCITIRLWS